MFRRLVPLAFLVLAACTTYRDQLSRGERAFEQNDPDRTLAILRDLEPDFQRLSPGEQASYAYIRGMTDLNVGYKSDARHWLSLANAYEQVTPGALSGDRKAKTTAALKELSEVVYAKGYEELVNAQPAAPASSSAPASPSHRASPATAPKANKEKPKASDTDTSDQD